MEELAAISSVKIYPVKDEKWITVTNKKIYKHVILHNVKFLAQKYM